MRAGPTNMIVARIDHGIGTGLKSRWRLSLVIACQRKDSSLKGMLETLRFPSL